MRIKKMNWFVKFITFNNVIGVSLAPFGIYVKEEYLNYKYILNHEKIHWKQQVEMLIIFFYIWYLIEWSIKLFSYSDISFEREAFNNDNNLEYLNVRKHYSWIKRIIK